MRCAWMLGLSVFLSGPLVLSAADMKEIEKRGTLRVIAGEGEQPEMFSFEAGGKPGFEREMLEGFANLKRVKLEIVRTKSFAERIPALVRGDGDVIVGLIDTPERRRQVAFSAEILPVRHLVVSHKPRPAVKTVAAFRAGKAGSIRGTTWAKETLAAGVPEAQVEYFADTEPLLDALAAGRVDSAVMTFSDFVLATKRRANLEPGVDVGTPGSAAWGLRKQDVELKAELDAYIDNLRSGPSWNRLVLLYFGECALSVLGRAER